MLKVSLNTDRAVYGIAIDTESRNINRFTDISLRQWFAQHKMDLDDEFLATGPFTALPTAAEYARSVSDVFSLIDPVLVSYGATAEGVVSGNYTVEEVGNSPPGQGTNAFLQSTSVLLDNETFRFAITEPITKTQSTTQSAIKLGSTLNDSFFDAPTKPESIRALGSATDEIILVWDPSIDDVAVVEYRIERDGELIATTPYPVYIDSGLPLQEFSYEITAVDVAGNESEISGPVIASPLPAADISPPLAPTVLLALDTLDSSIHLIWAQPSIEDVVSFNVFRGSDSQSLELHFKVTNTDAFDTFVVPGQTYCYQIEAADTSGNTSERSDLLCVEAGGLRSGNGINNQPLANWIVPDIESLDCIQTITSNSVLQGLNVVEPGCYNVPETLLLGPGATLRLKAGAVLVFDTDAGLVVSSNATLTTDGTTDEPVVLTGNVNVPGSWYGIEFEGSMSFGNLLKGAVIQYAGGGESLAGISATKRSRLRIENTLVQNNQKRAFHLSVDDTLIDEFNGNRIRDNESIGQIVFELLPSLTGNSDFSGNIDSEIEVPFYFYTNVDFTIPCLLYTSPSPRDS